MTQKKSVGAFFSREVDLSFHHVSEVGKLTFTKHLSVMLKSGITLREALQILTEQHLPPYFRSVIQKLEQGVTSGQNFAKTLAAFPQIFDSFYVQLVHIGEEAGTLEKNLEYLADHLRKGYEFRHKVRGALMYPAFILGVAVIAATGLSIFVLPKMVELFSSMDIVLPLSTRILIAFANFMQHFGILFVAGCVLSALGFRFLIAQKKIKPYWHTFLLLLPVYGAYLQHIELANFCRNLETMLRSGIPITDALRTQARSTDNVIFQEYISLLRAGIEQGKSLATLFRSDHFRFFPSIASHMIAVGEKSGKLDDSLHYLAEYFEGEVDNMSKNFGTLLEPIILVGVGLVVAFIAISIIAPIYQFTGSVQK